MRLTLIAVLAVLALLAACATPQTTSPAATSPAEPKTSTVAQNGEDDAPTVAVDLTEVTFRIEEDGTSTMSWHEVFRLRSAEPGAAWSHVFGWWRPWRDETPTLEATVVAPDGTTRTLDPKTVSDQANKNDDGMLTDEKLRIAPLPNLALGAVVDRKVSVRRKPLFVKGASVTLNLTPAAPEKKRVIVIDAPASVKLQLETFDTSLVPTRSESNGRVVVRYEQGATTPPSKRGEPGAPRGETPEPAVRVSTVASWQAAATAWTEKAEPQIDVAAVKQLATGLVAGQTTREGKIQALTAWLRRSVRYTGLELDEAAWVPRRSAEVLERKYGDCKDLSVLLTAMLRAVGIDADPALVMSGFDRDSTPGSPGLTQFNHAIVRVGSGPTLWIDATAPWTALGEVPPGVNGRMALVARADTTALTRVTSNAVSKLDSKLEWFFAPSGAVKTVRTRTSEGWIYRDGREVAARSPEEYRKNLETYAKERHETKGTIKVDISDAAAAGQFREVLEIPDSRWGRTDPEVANGFVNHDMAFAAISYLVQLDDRVEERKSPIEFLNGSQAHVLNVFHPPTGYRVKELPEPVKETVGPLTVSLAWKRGTGEDLEAALDVDFKGGTFTVDEAKRFVKEVFPKLDLQVRFGNVVFSAINEKRFHAAVKEAEALLAKNPTPTWRSLMAYALSAAGLQADAEAEARKAVADAPKDLLVRNRLAFVLIHNEHGLEFGRGFKRAELLKLLEESTALDAENEWSRRMHALVMMRDDDGNFVRDAKALAVLERELSEYREKTESAELDDELIDVWLRQKAWTKLSTELPKFPRTEQRDAAWLAAELVQKGAEPAFRRAAQEERLSEGSSGTATQYVMLAREYDTLGQLFAFLEKLQSQEQRTEARNNEMVNLLRRLKRQPEPAPGTVQATWLTLTTRLVQNAPPAQIKELVAGEMTEEMAMELRRMMGGLLGKLPRGGADVSGFAQDFMLTSATFDAKPLPGFGELVTMRVSMRGMTAPTSMLMKKGPRGYQVRFDFAPELAAKALELHLQGKQPEALEHLRALVQLTPDAPRALKEERADFEELGFAWAALTAVKHAPSTAAVVKWAEAQVARTDLSEYRFNLTLGALMTAWKDQPEKRLALAKTLEKSTETHRRDSALMLSVTVLQETGKLKEALALLETALAKAPRDRFLREVKSDLLPKLGQFEQSRAINRELAAEVEPSRAAGYLNDAAWWALFGKVDDAAVQEIGRSLEINATRNAINTAACVYASAGKFDSAAQEMMRMARSSDTVREQELHPSYWYARGLVAEGFGRLETAKALYKKVTKEEKVTTAADVWNLAQKRLSALR